MTKQEAFNEINSTQDHYISQLISLINGKSYEVMKSISFTSPTGTGKTRMMCKLINYFSDCYFIVTTLSKGQLHRQIREELKKNCLKENYTVYGSADYKVNSRLEAEDIINKIPLGTKCIWLRDEGHIKTNRYEQLLVDACFKIINFSATNTHSDIVCNFTHTMMLRTVNQNNGTPEDAISKLLEVKKAHKKVKEYNPCAIFRCTRGDQYTYKSIIHSCKANHLKYIDITDEAFDMSELCEDNNKYDVIINKYKLVEGVDIRRAHVLYMDNQPSNNATTIQAIGRCRRNALLYRNDIDILLPENKDLLEKTRECYVFYNIEKMKVDTDEEGELQYAFCNHISCESLKPNTTIYVENGQLPNGLHVIELKGETGRFEINTDKSTGFNRVSPVTTFYDTEVTENTNYIYSGYYLNGNGRKIKASNVRYLPLFVYKNKEHGEDPFYTIKGRFESEDASCEYSPSAKETHKTYKNKFSRKYLLSTLSDRCIDMAVKNADIAPLDKKYLETYVRDYIDAHQNKRGYGSFCKMLATLSECSVGFHWFNEEGEDFKKKKLKDFCDEKEIALIQYYCIEQKNCNKRTPDYCCTRQIYLLMKCINNGFLSDNKETVAKLIRVLFSKDYSFFGKNIANGIPKEPFMLYLNGKGERIVKETDMECYFKAIENKIDNIDTIYYQFDVAYHDVVQAINKIGKKIRECKIEKVVECYDDLFEDLTDTENYLVKNGYIIPSLNISKKELDQLTAFRPYKKIVNDPESAIIGTDTMRQISNKYGRCEWVESRSVTSKIGNYSKLNSYISQKYANILDSIRPQLFSGKNAFELDKRCNSMIGYCVEYYSKYLIYGSSYLGGALYNASREIQGKENGKYVVVRACMLKYREMMVRCFGSGVTRVIKSIPADKLAGDDYKYFVELVVELGKKTAEYVLKTLYPDGIAENDIDANLSVRHIAGLADYITKDTILDVKVKNCIDEKSVRQVLAYHYLSTKRSDLDIKRLIVYDAVSGKALTMYVK